MTEPIVVHPFSMADLATILHRARSRAGLTQAQLAAAVGVHPTVISKIEGGHREPGAKLFIRLVAATGSADLAALVCDCPAEGQSDPQQQVAFLKAKVLRHLRAQGFKVRQGKLLAPVQTNKDHVRRLHAEAVAAQQERSRSTLAHVEPRLLARLARGVDVDPHRIRPRLVFIEDRRSMDALLWRWCALHWSIPVSSGYGRRLRFLVIDEGHDGKVMGVIGLADPVFALGCRDTCIGWDPAMRRHKLACVMDAFVLGAVPPYSGLLGGKLAALLTGSTEVRDAFAQKYGHKRTLIAERDPHAHLALVTTTSALGRSSVYNRLRRPDATLAFQSVGFTQGTGDFHFSGRIYEDLAAFAKTLIDGSVSHRHANWTGTGFRNRREVIQRSLEGLGLDSRALRTHGVKREVFLHPLATNTYSWLRGESKRLRWITYTADDLGEWWRKRWAVPRAERDRGWEQFSPAQWRLYT